MSLPMLSIPTATPFRPAPSMSPTPPSPFAQAFARRFAFARQMKQMRHPELEVTQQWVAEQVSSILEIEPALRSASVSRWESGISVPDAETGGAAALALEV